MEPVTPVTTEEGITAEGYVSADFVAREAAKLEAEQPDAPEDETLGVEEAEPEHRASELSGDEEIPADDSVITNKFFKGKRVRDLYKSYEELERKLQEQGQELNRRKREEVLAQTLEKLNQRIDSGQPQPEAKPEPDVFEALNIDPERDPYLDFRGTLNKALEYERKRIREDLMREVEGKFQETEKQRAEREAREAGQRAFFSALDGARDSLQLDNERWKAIVPSVMQEIGNNPTKYGENAAYDPNKIAEATREVMRAFGSEPTGKPEAKKAPPQVQESPNPPGSTKPAGASVSPQHIPTMKAEEREMAESLWQTIADKHGWGDEERTYFFKTAAEGFRQQGARR